MKRHRWEYINPDKDRCIKCGVTYECRIFRSGRPMSVDEEWIWVSPDGLDYYWERPECEPVPVTEAQS